MRDTLHILFYLNLVTTLKIGIIISTVEGNSTHKDYITVHIISISLPVKGLQIALLLYKFKLMMIRDRKHSFSGFSTILQKCGWIFTSSYERVTGTNLTLPSKTIIYKTGHSILGNSFQALTNRQLMTVIFERRKMHEENVMIPFGFCLGTLF